MPRQTRFQDLMDRNNDSQLNPSELEELKARVARDEADLLLNSERLLKARYSELFTHSGRLSRIRLKRALNQNPP
jgi:hypothetical protein